MSKPTAVEQVRARRIFRPHSLRAEIFTIGPRKALMEHLEARTAINRQLFTTLPRSLRQRQASA